MRDICIRKAMNGFIVTVGCQTLVFESQNKLIAELDRYLLSPAEVEQAYIRDYKTVGCDTPTAGQELPSGYYNGGGITGSVLGSYPETAANQRSYNTASEGPLRVR